MSEQQNPSARKRRLGRGLSAIVGDIPNGGAPTSLPVGISTPQPLLESSYSESVILIPLEKILPNRHQPRAVFDEAALASLADSIRAVGVIQPVVVRPAEDGLYELISGERRVRACGLAGLESVPAIVRSVDEQRSAEAALIENLQREDLNPIERSDAIRSLIETFGLNQTEVAERVGLDRSSVSNLLRLGELEEEVRALLISGTIGLGHGKALLAAPAGAARVRLALEAARDGWSVRRLESVVSGRAAAPAAGGGVVRATSHSAEMADLERRLGEYLGTRVQIQADRHGRGVFSVRFYSLDHFDDLMSRVGFGRGRETEY